MRAEELSLVYSSRVSSPFSLLNALLGTWKPTLSWLYWSWISEIKGDAQTVMPRDSMAGSW